MRRLLGLSLFFALAASLPAVEIVLPGDDFVPGWKASGKASVFIQADLFNHIDGGADIFLEFGFQRVIVQRYDKVETELIVEIYEMAGPESALGIYLVKCGRETPFDGIPARNSSETTQFTIVKGRYFIQVDNFGEDKTAVPAMAVLAQSILGQVADEPADPGLLSLLTKEKLIAGSERLVRGPVALQPYFTFGEGDVFRQGGTIFGTVGEYLDDAGRKSGRLVIGYPAEATALEVLSGVKAGLDPYLKIVESGEKGFVFEDFKGGFGRVRVSGARLEAFFNLAVRPPL